MLHAQGVSSLPSSLLLSFSGETEGAGGGVGASSRHVFVPLTGLGTNKCLPSHRLFQK